MLKEFLQNNPFLTKPNEFTIPAGLAFVIICFVIYRLLKSGLFWKLSASDLQAEYKGSYKKHLLGDFENKFLSILTPRIWFGNRLESVRIAGVYNEVSGVYKNFKFRAFRVKRQYSLKDSLNRSHHINSIDNFIIVEFIKAANINIDFEIRGKLYLPKLWSGALKNFVKNDIDFDNIKGLKFSSEDFFYKFFTKPDDISLKLFSQNKVQDYIFDLLEIPPGKRKKIVYGFMIKDNCAAIHFNGNLLAKNSLSYPLAHYLEYITSIAEQLNKKQNF